MKGTYYFSHDYNVRSNPSIKRIQMDWGMEGYGIFWALIEDLYNNEGSMILDYKCIAFDLRVDEEKIISIVNDYDLFEVNENIISCPGIDRRLESRKATSQKKKDAANKRWGKVKKAKEETETKQEHAKKEPLKSTPKAQSTAKQTSTSTDLGNGLTVMIPMIPTEHEAMKKPPTVDEVYTYILEKYGVESTEEARKFIEYNSARGWRIKNNPVYSWQPLLEKWIERIRDDFEKKKAKTTDFDNAYKKYFG